MISPRGDYVEDKTAVKHTDIVCGAYGTAAKVKARISFLKAYLDEGKVVQSCIPRAIKTLKNLQDQLV